MPIKYDRIHYNIGALEEHWADYKIVQFIGERKKVLEIGCATGYVGQYLKENCGCDLVGVELDEESANRARIHYRKVILGSIADAKTLESLGEEKFDVILCGNVLEHVAEPLDVLKNLKLFLKKEGAFVIALPNIAHWSIRLSLLRGQFNYTETGILDRSHLKFFTLSTAQRLLNGAGLKIDAWDFDWDKGIPKWDGFFLRIPKVGPKFLRFFYSLNPTLFGYQFIFKAKPI